MIASILGYFTMSALSGVAGKLWKGFCDFISTPIGAALIAGFIMFNVGIVHEYRINNAKWQAKWAAAEATAEQKRIARDVTIKARVEADANSRLAELAARKDELEKKVQAYADDEEKQRAVGNTGRLGSAAVKTDCGCLTDSSDDKWLSDAQRKRTYVKPKAFGGFALRLRTLGR